MTYDVVIVGASVAGLATGFQLAKAGLQVCIVDRRAAIGVPVRCGEATGNRAELARFVDIDESWIACDIGGLVAHVNDSFTRRLPVADGGVMLHRDRFEQSLARQASAAGAVIRLNTPVSGLLRTNGRCAGVTLANGGRIEASFVVGADGAESYVGRWAGLTMPLAADEVASTVQYRMTSDFCNDGFLHFFIGADTIPYGYIWVFPKGNGAISVGGGMYRRLAGQPPVRHFVDRFIKKYLSVTPQDDTLVCGAIPITLAPRKLTKDNIVIVGDAARQVNPLTAGGIMNAMESADLAARYVCSQRKRDSYSTAWRRNQRRQHKLFMLIREIWFSTPEERIVPRLKTVFSLADYAIDRTKPFTLPVVALVKFLWSVLPQTLRHIRILFR